MSSWGKSKISTQQRKKAPNIKPSIVGGSNEADPALTTENDGNESLIEQIVHLLAPCKSCNMHTRKGMVPVESFAPDGI